MATYEEAVEASRMVVRTHAELNHLIRLLEADPYWQMRDQMPEPLRSKLYQCESGIISIRESMRNNAPLSEGFIENAERLQPLLAAGMELPAELTDALPEIIKTAHACVSTYLETRTAIIGVINGSRASRGENPLTGAEGTSN